MLKKDLISYYTNKLFEIKNGYWELNTGKWNGISMLHSNESYPFKVHKTYEFLSLADLMKEQGVSTDLSDYWDKECELNPSNPHCLEYDD